MIVTMDQLLGGRVKLRQPETGYRVAVDPVLLAAAVDAERGDQIVDLGCGVGAAILCLMARVPGLVGTGIERDRHLAELARENGAANRADLEIVEADAMRPPSSLVPADWVISNPPFHEAGASDPSPHERRAAATVEAVPPARWVEAARKLLKNRGRLAFIYRADRLHELLAALDGFGGIRVVPLWPKQGRAAKRVIVIATRGSKAPLSLEPGLVLHEPDGPFTPAATLVLRDGLGLFDESVSPYV